jgi:hypothetical protein
MFLTLEVFKAHHVNRTEQNSNYHLLMLLQPHCKFRLPSIGFLKTNVKVKNKTSHCSEDHRHVHWSYNHEHICYRNTLVILDYKTEFNVKGQLTDRLDNGQLKGEFDLTIPTGHRFTGKVCIAVTLWCSNVFLI